MNPRLLIPLCFAFWLATNAAADERPNILWLFAEDTSPWMGCYGDAVNEGQTPNIDALARRGVRFSKAFVPAPVCSACRSALMGGLNQIRFNAHEHRSSRGPAKITLPEHLKLLPQLMKESGYFTFNCGKDDYNFVWDHAATYSLQRKRRDAIPWETLNKQQPFFGQIQTAGGKNNTRQFPASRKVDPDTVTVPADYPQNALYREVVAQHYDAIRMDDDFIGKVLRELEQAGLAENTIVVYFSDHGANNLVRHKQMPTEGGLHVPFIIAGPDPWVPAAGVRDDLVNLLDLSATTLAWAGCAIPDWYEGQDLFGFKVVPREYVAAAKDRLDHTIDRVRSLRTARFRYTRNYKTDRVFLQPQYRDGRPFVVNLRELYASGELSAKLTEIYFGERPAEEFYDVQADPAQLENLVGDPRFAEQLQRHRQLLDNWLAAGDWGAQEESDEELAYQANGQKWGEGVNPEYERVRQDSDGDGLSDDWERIHGRDAHDGRLLFTFDCGGWQTEGWKGLTGIAGNIAGYQGYLDFELAESRAVLQRSGLAVPANANTGELSLHLRANQAVTVALAAQSDASPEWADIGQARYQSDGWQDLRIPLTASTGWRGQIRQLQLVLTGPEGTVVEVDRLRVVAPTP